MTTAGEKKKVVMGELLNNAEPTARRVITAYNPDQKYKVNLKNLKACKAAPLEACAKLLGLAPRDEDNKTTRDALPEPKYPEQPHHS